MKYEKPLENKDFAFALGMSLLAYNYGWFDRWALFAGWFYLVVSFLPAVVAAIRAGKS